MWWAKVYVKKMTCFLCAFFRRYSKDPGPDAMKNRFCANRLLLVSYTLEAHVIHSGGVFGDWQAVQVKGLSQFALICFELFRKTSQKVGTDWRIHWGLQGDLGETDSCNFKMEVFMWKVGNPFLTLASAPQTGPEHWRRARIVEKRRELSIFVDTFRQSLIFLHCARSCRNLSWHLVQLLLAWLPLQSLAVKKKTFFGANFRRWKTFKICWKVPVKYF